MLHGHALSTINWMSVELCVLCVWTWTPSGSHCIVLVSGHNGKSRGQAGLSSTLKRVAFAFSSRANSIYIYEYGYSNMFACFWYSHLQWPWHEC